jgi:hypothetical protein
VNILNLEKGNGMKVFCGDCKYHTFLNVHTCNKNPNPCDTFLKREYELNRCSDKNRNNDCPDYKPSLWTRIKDFFGWNS